MTDYSELVKALRETAKHLDGISRFPYDDDPAKRIYSKNMADAAAAIEELKAIAHSHCVAASAYWEELEELKAQLPKRGEWIWIQKANGGQYKGCSVCHAPIPTDSMLDYLDDEDCDFCYSCGAKMEVQE